jgi:hypothetical protein
MQYCLSSSDTIIHIQRKVNDVIFVFQVCTTSSATEQHSTGIFFSCFRQDLPSLHRPSLFNCFRGCNAANLLLSCKPVLRIHDILVWIRIRIRGSMPLLMDPDSDADLDPSIFIIVLQDAKKNKVKKVFLHITF